MDKEKIMEIIQLDCRQRQNVEIIQSELVKIKPLAKYQGEKVPIEELEKLVSVLSNKYNVHLVYISVDTWSNENLIIWRSSVLNDNVFKPIIIYGASIYEVFAKSALYMYSIREEAGRRPEKRIK